MNCPPDTAFPLQLTWLITNQLQCCMKARTQVTDFINIVLGLHSLTYHMHHKPKTTSIVQKPQCKNVQNTINKFVVVAHDVYLYYLFKLGVHTVLTLKIFCQF